MKPIENFFTETQILRQICRIRVKLAKNRSKKHLLHLLTSNPKFNYHTKGSRHPRNPFEEYQNGLILELNKILPPRKKWATLGKESRKKSNNSNELLTSNDKNFYALLKTIKSHEKSNSQELWFVNLTSFVKEIRESVITQSASIAPPIVFPKLKEKLTQTGQNECRPICMFNLRDRIILSLTNKFLTQLFDNYFQTTSYAFRAKKNTENQILSHHDCVKNILEYRKKKSEATLFVVECDMKKFYDTVNQTIVKEKFNELIRQSQEEHPHLMLDFAIRVFYNYLDSFCFNKDIPDKLDFEYWSSYGIPNGFFGWVDEDIPLHYQNLSNERIGIPQGGALSGLIANIYLNEADIKLKEFDIFYSRFCDDMIIISSSVTECNKAKDAYVATLENLKLFPHPFKDAIHLIDFDENDNIFYKSFWEGKSKGPYPWGEIKNLNFPWIGFVGYEINYKGEIRIRKKSLEKELKKQKTIVKEIENAIKTGMRKPKGTATESTINRLIGMSVGRIGLDNFDEVSTDLCWKNGFKLLTINKYSTIQIKELDRNRNKHYYKLLSKIEKLPEIKSSIKPRQIVKYNKPFSYYYQVLERQELLATTDENPEHDS